MTAPCVLYVLDAPEEFPDGMSIEAPVTLTGFSYKRWAYQGANGDLMVAPVVLAKNLQWSRSEPKPRPSVSGEKIVWSIVLAFAISVVIVRWALFWSGRRGRRSAEGDGRPVDFGHLDQQQGDDDS